MVGCPLVIQKRPASQRKKPCSLPERRPHDIDAWLILFRRDRNPDDPMGLESSVRRVAREMGKDAAVSGVVRLHEDAHELQGRRIGSRRPRPSQATGRSSISSSFLCLTQRRPEGRTGACCRRKSRAMRRRLPFDLSRRDREFIPATETYPPGLVGPDRCAKLHTNRSPPTTALRRSCRARRPASSHSERSHTR